MLFRCSDSESRVAAYDVLVELANDNLENLRKISRELVNMHHMPNPELANQWDVGVNLSCFNSATVSTCSD